MFMILRSLFLSLLLVNTGFASVTVKEFSAVAVMTIPGQPVTKSKLFVGDKAVRTEVQIQSGMMVDIVYPYEGRLIKLNPEYKQYMELPIQKQSPDDELNPCNSLLNSTCSLLANEDIDGRKTQKWQIISVQQGKKVRTLHWVDIKRQLALREFFNDGSMAEMKLEKIETINQRKTEKWVRTVSRPDGSMVSSFQWYDPQLEISIREELPGGYVRELTNIKLGKQKTKLFEIPEGYKLPKTNQMSHELIQPYR